VISIIFFISVKIIFFLEIFEELKDFSPYKPIKGLRMSAVLLTIASLFGIAGELRELAQKLTISWVIMPSVVILLVITFLIGIFHSEELTKLIDSDVQYIFDNFCYENNSLEALKVMKKYKCCGWKSPEDLNKCRINNTNVENIFKTLNISILPCACCPSSYDNCVKSSKQSVKSLFDSKDYCHLNSSDLSNETCNKKIQQIFSSDIDWILYLIGISIVLAIGSICLSIILSYSLLELNYLD
jgi:hypothetical protein